MFNRLFGFKSNKLQGFPLLDLPRELITDAMPLSTSELSKLIVSRATHKIFQPSIRLRGVIRLIEAMLNLDYDKVIKIVGSDPEILLTNINAKISNSLTISTTPLQFAASEYNVRMIKLFLFAIEDNAPEKKERFLQQLLQQQTFLNLDGLWEHYDNFKHPFILWLNRLNTDEQFNAEAEKFGLAQLALLPRHFLAEMLHHYFGTPDEWHATSSFNATPAPHQLIAVDVTEHYTSNFNFLGISSSSSSHKLIKLNDSKTPINFFLLRGSNSDAAMHGGALHDRMAIHARQAIAFPATLTLTDAPVWLITNGVNALEFDLATLQQLFTVRSDEFKKLIESLQNNITIERPVSAGRCAIL